MLNCKNYKEIISFILISFFLVGCGNKTETIDSENHNVYDQDVLTSVEQFVEEPVEEPEEPKELTQDDLIRLDEESDAISMIISQYKLEYTEQKEPPVYSFEDLVDDFYDIKENNLFAQQVIDIAQGVGYGDLSRDEKVVFDTYLGLLFQDKVVRNNQSVGVLTEAWEGDGHATDKEGNEYETQYYLLKFSEYNKLETSTFSEYVFLLYYDMGWGGYNALKTPEKTFDKQYGNYRDCLYEQDGKMALKTTFEGSVYVEALDVDSLNSLIASKSEFIDFMMYYRDTVYAPTRIAQLNAEDERKKAQREEDKYWENKMPEIGMTAAEVKKTSWGSPDKINKDTYEWGTTEQWVYEKKGYVYFRDGVVSSVSER